MNTKEIAAKVREQLKRELPGWKFSVTMERFSGGSSITLRLMSGPEAVLVDGDGAQMNQYTFLQEGAKERYQCWNNGAHLTDKGWDVMEQATKTVAQYHWDKSEPMTDYFCCNFYYSVNVGAWDRPYQINVSKPASTMPL